MQILRATTVEKNRPIGGDNRRQAIAHAGALFVRQVYDGHVSWVKLKPEDGEPLRTRHSVMLERQYQNYLKPWL
ncbi:hypothetical protein [Salinibacter phage M31CR41-2]|uniref:Uncharacterized protein n=2 Tax=Kairosalinivirus TaxID=2560158 RepID=A0A2I6UH56_9CAUD|nr:hypothetical protein FGG68_gp26 [Salinibacter phage M31CR41-2]YP_009639672.1 hypothetical protein FGG69_gp60 [Salinibacter phage SRUTV-1]ATU47053.1 hypothetical protein [Salinibacter phage SRUTV-1]AUO79324.1 hypothetical protein [Salinibacter phage M31CR41-2]AUO79394.1 hypothetical protein [Salinibacter virus M31CR41-3]